ncbi:MAG: LamG domain-containing protein, partial [Elusimicrobia bacterium]|nr:LamG domain-containing protein [Elusimicrobiota bacterium]
QIREDALGPKPAYSAKVSVDGGQTFKEVLPSYLSMTGDYGTKELQIMTAQSIHFTPSLNPLDTTNRITLSATDIIGNTAISTVAVFVNLNPVTSLQQLLPANKSFLNARHPKLSWVLAGKVPLAAIENFEVSVDTDPTLTNPTTFLSSAVLNFVIPQPLVDGTYYWKVRAKDRFGSFSPYSSTQQFKIDTTPPEFLEPLVAKAETNIFVSTSMALNSPLVDIKAKIRDMGIGLAVSSAPQPISGTTGLWHFNEGQGNITADFSGLGNNGTITNAQWVDGRLNKALYFAGYTSKVEFTNSPAYDLQGRDFTIELWFNLSSLEGNGMEGLIEKIGTLPTVPHIGWSLFLWNYTDSIVLEGYDENGLVPPFMSPGGLYKPNTFNHLAVTRQGNIWKMYFNGEEIASRVSDRMFTPTTQPLQVATRFGGFGGGSPFIVDEVRMLDFALDAGQIREDALGPKPAYSAKVSVDGGQTFNGIPHDQISVPSLDGSTQQELFNVANLELVGSETPNTNQIDLTASDLLGNTTGFLFSVIVDTVSPAIAISSPSAGEQFIAKISSIPINVSLADNLDPNPQFTKLELVQIENKGLLGGATTLAVHNSDFVDPFSIDDGLWVLEAQAKDWVDNSTKVVSGVFEVIHDVLPPRTMLAISEPKVGADPVFVRSDTPFVFTAIDDSAEVGDSLGMGVAGITLSLDNVFSQTIASSAPTTPFVAITTFFGVQDSSYTLSFFATDAGGNQESTQTIKIALDTTPPVTSLAASTPTVLTAESLNVVSAQSLVGLSAVDPLVNGAAVGLVTTTFKIALASETLSDAPL